MEIELDLVFLRGSELTWFLGGGRKWLGFRIWIEIDLLYVGGRTLLDFRTGIKIDIIFF